MAHKKYVITDEKAKETIGICYDEDDVEEMINDYLHDLMPTDMEQDYYRHGYILVTQEDMRTEKEIYEQAIKDYEELCLLVNGKTYKQLSVTLRNKHIDYWNYDGELFDMNYGVCCFTINIDAVTRVCKVNDKSIEVWDDEGCDVLELSATIDEIIKKASEL